MLPHVPFAVRWRTKNNQTDLSDLYLGESDGVGWIHSMRLTEVRTAKEWGLSPSQFRSLSMEDQAEMVAHDRVTDQMARYENRKNNKKGVLDSLFGSLRKEEGKDK